MTDESDYAGESNEDRDGIVFSFQSRQRIRDTAREVHALVTDRLRRARRQGAAASPASFAGEVRAVHRAIQHARTQHGPARDVANSDVRECWKALAASAIILAERATRPPELPRGQKSSTEKWKPVTFREA